ncbi:SPOR domain-containing protein [Gangjinia marincola]
MQSYAQQGTVTIEQDPQIMNLINKRTELNKANKLGTTYRVQLYSGTNGGASGVIKNYTSLFSEWPGTVKYDTPNYKVWVGKFSDRLAAERALMAIRKEFPNAFLVKENRSR